MLKRITDYLKTWSAADVLFVLFGGLGLFIVFNLLTENVSFLQGFTPGVIVILFALFALFCIAMLMLWHRNNNAKKQKAIDDFKNKHQ
ncbi:MAG: hypothetical protein ACXWDO_06695 [Bacteroidia bacterium]